MSDATTTLLSSIFEQEEDLGDGHRVVRFSLSGEPHLRAVIGAVAEHYNEIAERVRPTPESLAAFVGQKVTVVRVGESAFGAGQIAATEGTIFIGHNSGQPAILPKRKRRQGQVLQNVIDVFPGYCTQTAREYVNNVRMHFPLTKALTQERLLELPRQSDTLSLCVFGEHRLPDSRQVDALYLYGEYDPDNDIVDTGVVLVRPEHGVSEHGSIFGEQLLRSNVGEVVGFEPISFGEGISLCDLDFDEAYARVIGSANTAILAGRA